jgi:glycerophosphoryl diester phosphodiesterase
VPLIFAHRGLHTTKRENTLGAFDAARALGVDGVELDVRRCSDGEIAVHHDATIAGRPLAETPFSELPDYVATLAEALQACAGLVVNVEIKNAKHASEPDDGAVGGFAREVVEVVRAADRLRDVVISCFDLATCRAARDAEPAVRVGWLLRRTRDVAASAERAHDVGLHAIHPNHRNLDAPGVQAAHGLGLEVNVWTVNRRRRIIAMTELGVDGLITDDPATALTLAGRPVGGSRIDGLD